VFAVNPLGVELAGCPLDEKISEMHALRKAGDAIGALALVVLDNPMCAGTGHRICNDCEEVEIGTDQVIWSTDGGPPIVPTRPQDAHFRGNIVQALLAYQAGELGRPLVPLDTVDRLIAIGSDGMMHAVTAARHGVLAPYLKRGHVAIASVNSPMQCMLKEVCAQCLQKHVDAATGRETFVFSCFNQDQDMDRGLRQPRSAAAPEYRPGEAVGHVARSSPFKTLAAPCVITR
jgi:hypothetical protein